MWGRAAPKSMRFWLAAPHRGGWRGGRSVAHFGGAVAQAALLTASVILDDPHYRHPFVSEPPPGRPSQRGAQLGHGSHGSQPAPADKRTLFNRLVEFLSPGPDSHEELIELLAGALMVLPIVIWVMRDQFDTIPNEMEQAALVDGCSIWGAFFRIVLPIALPGMVAAFILSLVLCWNEYFFASLLTGFDAQTLPVMVASQTGSQGINWWTMAALATAAIAPLVLIGIFLERYIVMGLTAGSGK